MKPYILFFALLLLVSNMTVHGQTHRIMPILEGAILYADSSHLNSSLIPEKPVTNREYLTYLSWLHSVYANYPEQLIEAFPGYSESNSQEYRKSMQIEQDTSGFGIISNLLSILPKNIIDYNFSPEFIDYPVMNISWKQAMACCNWLSDRYNEALLMDKEILLFDPMQSDMNCFTTESYLFSQYEGQLNKPFKDPSSGEERIVRWQDKLLFPSFRLPSSKELKQLKVQLKLKPYNSFQFLNKWIEFYINTSGSQLLLQNPGSGQQLIVSTQKAAIKHSGFQILSEYDLDASEAAPNMNAIDIFKRLEQDLVLKIESPVAEKDSLGHMPFILIGEDSNSNPLFLKRIKYKTGNFSESCTFRFAVSTVR